MIKLVTQFLRVLKTQKHYSAHTIQNYERDLLRFSAYLKQEEISTFQAVSDTHCREFLTRLYDQKLHDHSILRQLSSCRSLWNYLLSQNLVDHNPFIDIKGPKKQKNLARLMEPEQLHHFLDQLPHNSNQEIRNKAIFELLYATGCRVSELCRLRLEDLDLIEGECRVQGKGNKDRIALFGDSAKKALLRYLHKVYPKWAPAKNTILFLSQKGTPITSRTIQRDLKKALTQAGLSSNITPHSLRHSFATDLLNNGANLKAVQDLLGHESITSTQIYTHLSTEKLEKTFKDAHPRA